MVATEAETVAAFVPEPAGRLGLRGSPEPIAALNRVKIREYAEAWEAREPLVDVRTYCPEVSFHGGLCPYLRQSVADRLNRAQASLESGYRLRAGTCLRTLSMQKGGWDGYFRRMREAHPEWPLSSLRRAVNKYFAPYDQKAPPGHCTGGAVDVGLLDPIGVALDMTAPTKGWEAAYTWSEKISPEAKANRMRMVEAMLGAGFSNCRDEFWHYSWGDSAWAVRVGETECPFGWAHPPVALETDFPRAHAVGLQMETTRDRNGRALHAEGECALPAEFERTAEGTPQWSVGLYWANGIPVSLHLSGFPDLRPDTVFYIGDGKEKWEPLPQTDREGAAVVLSIVPGADRVVLASYIPEPPPKAESEPRPA